MTTEDGGRHMGREHHYRATVRWTGNLGAGTESFLGYDRSHNVTTDGRPAILCSSDPSFNGDPRRWNPELLLVASASQCHMLWFLHLSSTHGIVVIDYEDTAEAVMIEDADGGGRFESILLRPIVTVAAASMVSRARELHDAAAQRCFIANSLNFRVRHEPLIQFSGSAASTSDR